LYRFHLIGYGLIGGIQFRRIAPSEAQASQGQQAEYDDCGQMPRRTTLGFHNVILL
jgi:hypothetical protein